MLVAHSKFPDAVKVLRQVRHRRRLTLGVSALLLALAVVVGTWSDLSSSAQTVLGSVAGLALVVFVPAAYEWRRYSKAVSCEREDGHIRWVGSVARSRLRKFGRSCGFVPGVDDFYEFQRVADHAQSSWMSERQSTLDAMRKRS